MVPVLCIVVPTIPGRESLLSRCLWSITEQWRHGLQVLAVPGEGLLGDKITKAVASTTASYVTVVDDDDYLSAAYVAETFPLLADGVDFVGFKVVQWIDNTLAGIGSTRGDRPGYMKRGNNHGPSPKGITRRELWCEVPMGNDYYADRRWSAAIAERITTHKFVDRALYVYDHQPATSAFLGGGFRDVGMWPYDRDRVQFLD